MDYFPLWNSLRIAIFATAIIFALGLASAYYIAKLPPKVKGVLDVLLTLPLVLPPTVIGFFLLKLLGPQALLGRLAEQWFQWRLVMVWPAAIASCVVVSFPLMYRTARGAFESFDYDLWRAGQTLGMSNTRLFWRVLLPTCKKGLTAGMVLAFARCLGEYGATSMVAGYTPGRTATISTTVYQMWRIGKDDQALFWVLINLAISLVVLLCINMMERSDRRVQGSI